MTKRVNVVYTKYGASEGVYIDGKLAVSGFEITANFLSILRFAKRHNITIDDVSEHELDDAAQYDFDAIEEMPDTTETLTNSLKVITKNPYHVEGWSVFDQKR